MSKTRIASCLCFFGICSWTIMTQLYAKDIISEIASQSQGKAHSSDVPIVEERKIDFELNADLLASGAMQLASILLDSEEFSDPKYSRYNFDNWELKHKDHAVLSKSAIVYQNVKPSFFSCQKLISSDYLEVSMVGSENRVADRQRCIIEQTTDFKIKKVTMTTRLSHFDYSLATGHMLSPFEADKAATNFSLDSHKPQMISSTFSGPDDVQTGSYGGRTFNLYYDINERDTLCITYSLITLKPETWMKWTGVWSLILSSATENYRERTISANRAIRSYFQGMRTAHPKHDTIPSHPIHFSTLSIPFIPASQPRS